MTVALQSSTVALQLCTVYKGSKRPAFQTLLNLKYRSITLELLRTIKPPLAYRVQTWPTLTRHRVSLASLEAFTGSSCRCKKDLRGNEERASRTAQHHDDRPLVHSEFCSVCLPLSPRVTHRARESSALKDAR